MPGSGMWYESSKLIPFNPHYKSNCWICDRHVFSIIFWSKGMAYKLDPILDKQQSEIIRFEIDRNFGKDEDKDLYYVNGNLSYDDQEDRVPYLCGSFTGWRYLKMISLEDKCRSLDEELKSPFELAKDMYRVKKWKKLKECDDWEKRWIEVTECEQQIHYMYDWQDFLPKSLNYKKPFILNGHMFTEKPSPDGTLPDELVNDGQAEVLLTDSSEEEETVEEESEEEE